MGHVFISYSHKDDAYVDRLAAYLAGVGVEVWTDKGIAPGTEWVRTIERQLHDCAVFVPVMSRHSREAGWVANEILLALQLRTPIMPLLLGGEPFLELLNIQHEDVTGGRFPRDAYVRRLQALTGSTKPELETSAPVGVPSLTLHAAMAMVLQSAPQRMMRASDLAAEINARRLYRMRDGRPVEVQQIHARVGNNPHMFVKEGWFIKLV